MTRAKNSSGSWWARAADSIIRHMDSRVSGRPAAASLSGAAGGGAASEESGCACADAPGAHVASSIATINRRVARMEIRPDVGPQDFVLAYRSESSWTILLPFLAEGVSALHAINCIVYQWLTKMTTGASTNESTHTLQISV